MQIGSSVVCVYVRCVGSRSTSGPRPRACSLAGFQAASAGLRGCDSFPRLSLAAVRAILCFGDQRDLGLVVCPNRKIEVVVI